MRIQSELCHIDESRAVVRVSAWDDQLNLGSTLGEGPTTRVAEENGIKQLLKRISLGEELLNYYLTNDENNNQETDQEKNIDISLSKNQLVTKQIIRKPDILQSEAEASQASQPEDWSKELMIIDSNIKQLGWVREEENNFLKEQYEISDRNRITSYEMLKSYLDKLNNLVKTANKMVVANNEPIKPLLAKSDKLIGELKWDTVKAREFLLETMNVSSRQKLDSKGLENFNNHLNIQLEAQANNTIKLASD